MGAYSHNIVCNNWDFSSEINIPNLFGLTDQFHVTGGGNKALGKWVKTDKHV